MSITLRELSRHTGHDTSPPLSLRKVLAVPNASLRLHVGSVPFSVMTHNMALLVFPGDYLGTDRQGAIQEIIARIKALAPDVVGLCEVFANDERQFIRQSVQQIYPHFREGPDLSNPLSDGGQLVLSRHPILQSHQMVYTTCAGADCLANKGVIHVRIQPAPAPVPFDIFYSHTQDIEPNGGAAALYTQLTQMNTVIGQWANPDGPTIVMGDLNIPAEIPNHYEQLLARLHDTVDLWTVAGHAVASGFTVTTNNNFYEDAGDAPAENQRLDYVMLKAGRKLTPILRGMGILAFAHNGRFISDHFGLRAVFDDCALISAS